MVTKTSTNMNELHTHTHTYIYIILKNTEKNEKHKEYYALKYIH